MNQKPYVIVVGMDFSPLADRAFAKAHELAAVRKRAEIHVVSVVPATNVGFGYPLSGYVNVDPTHVVTLEDTAAQLHEHIEKALAKLERPSVSNIRVVSHVRLDTPSIGVTSLASELEADLIVLGTEGHHGLARWLLGSVAEGVVRHAGCPVLVIPPERTAQPIPKIEPACPRCIEARKETAGEELWCAQHRERHGRRHTYHQGDRSGAETNMPLVTR